MTFLKPAIKKILRAMLVVALLSLPGCLIKRGNNDVVASQPKPTTGGKAINLDNGRARCGFEKTASENVYDVLCKAMVILADGNEAVAESIEDGVSIDWLQAELPEGANAVARILKDEGLSARYEVTLTDGVPTTAKLPLKISKAEEFRIDRDSVFLPFDIDTIGDTLQSLNFADLVQSSNILSGTRGVIKSQNIGVTSETITEGLQNPYKGHQDFLLDHINSICHIDGLIYFSTPEHIYTVDSAKGRIQVYAGSQNLNNKSDYSHRLRIRLTNPIIYCSKDGADTSLFVADSGPSGSRVLELRDKGSVSVHTGKSISENILGSDVHLVHGLAITKDRTLIITYQNTDLSHHLLRKKLGTSIPHVTQDIPIDAVDFPFTLQLAVDQNNRLYIPDPIGNRLLFVDENVAPANENSFALGLIPNSVHIASNGKTYVAGGNAIYEFNRMSNTLESAILYSNNSITNLSLKLNPLPFTVIEGSLVVGVDEGGSLGNHGKHLIRQIDPTFQLQSLLAGSNFGELRDGGASASAQFSDAKGIALASDGAIYLADSGNHRIRRTRKISSTDESEIVETIAGTGIAGATGDGASATSATINGTNSLAIASDGTIYFSDTNNNRIRKIAPDGSMQNVAGSGLVGFSGDNGDPTLARLRGPTGLAFDAASNSLYIADTGNSRIRKIDLTLNRITTVLGTESGLTGANRLFRPSGITIGRGEIVITDPGNILNPSLRLRVFDFQTFQAIGQITIGENDSLPSGKVQMAGDHLLVTDDENGIIHQFTRVEGQAGSYTKDVEPFFGGSKGARDCGARSVKGKALSAGVRNVFKTSLASVCPGVKINDISVVDRCSSEDPKMLIAFTQRTRESVATGTSNAVKILSPCQAWYR